MDDALATAARLTELGMTRLVEVEARSDGLFGALVDPDGNYIQIIQLRATTTGRDNTSPRRRG